MKINFIKIAWRQLTRNKVYSAIINSFNEEFVEDWQKKRTKKLIVNPE